MFYPVWTPYRRYSIDETDCTGQSLFETLPSFLLPETAENANRQKILGLLRSRGING